MTRLTQAKPVRIDAARVLEMLGTMEPDEIAAHMEVPLEDVTAIIARSKASQRWVLECQKTGRHWPCWSERACYLRAQIMGLTDYNFGRVA